MILFPHLQDFRLLQISCDGKSIQLECERTTTTVLCPLCGNMTNHRSIPLDVGRLLESRVEVVPCPTCGSVGKAKIKGQSAVIAPHPPRKVRSVRNVTRWMELGAAWILIQKKEEFSLAWQSEEPYRP